VARKRTTFDEEKIMSPNKKMTREQRRMRVQQVIFGAICLLVVISMVVTLFMN
jgi:predicted nucleic acid-binding Zn ribbon protein